MEFYAAEFLESIRKDQEQQGELERKFFDSCQVMHKSKSILAEPISDQEKITKLNAVSKFHGFDSIQATHNFRMGVLLQLRKVG